jgi:integrase
MTLTTGVSRKSEKGTSKMGKRGSGGVIVTRRGKNGTVGYLPRFESGYVDGKRVRSYGRTHSTKKAAQEELRELMVKFDKGEHVATTRLTVAAWIAQWLTALQAREVMGGIGTRTREAYSERLITHVAPRIGAIELQKLTKNDINALYLALRQSGSRSSAVRKTGISAGLSQRSVRLVHDALQQCLKAAVDDHKILRNPCDGAEVPRSKKASNKVRAMTSDAEGAGKVRALDQDQQRALLEAFRDTPWFTLVALGLATGLRRGELLGLRWSAIDLGGAGRSPTVTVERTVEKTKTHGVRLIEGAKTAGSVRTLAVDSGTCEQLRLHRKQQRETALKLGVSYPSDCLVFPNVIKRPRGGRPADGPEPRDADFNRPQDPSSVTKEFSRLAKAAGFKDFSLHGLRHSHATALLLAGVPVHVVSRRLGHSSPILTLSVYAHAIPSGEDQAVQAADAMMRSALQRP